MLQYLKQTLIGWFVGQFGRLEYFFYNFLIFVALGILVTLPPLMASIVTGPETIGFLLLPFTLLVIPFSLVVVVFCLGLSVKRIRDILSSRPARETYLVATCFWLLGVIIPPFGIVTFILLIALPGGFDRSMFYQENIKVLGENASLKIAELMKPSSTS